MAIIATGLPQRAVRFMPPEPLGAGVRFGAPTIERAASSKDRFFFVMDVTDFYKIASVIWLDVILSGDNALVIGMAAASLPEQQRRFAIGFGLAMATIIRVISTIGATFLLAIPGILIVGGAALLWVAYKLLRDALDGHHADVQAGAVPRVPKTLFGALITITIADVSMSIDNVLAVAAIARDDLGILAFGLILSILLMAFAASIIMRLIVRYAWLSFGGVALLAVISAGMIYEGVLKLSHAAL
jgi:YjbE family integral membrane protein